MSRLSTSQRHARARRGAAVCLQSHAFERAVKSYDVAVQAYDDECSIPDVDERECTRLLAIVEVALKRAIRAASFDWAGWLAKLSAVARQSCPTAKAELGNLTFERGHIVAEVRYHGGGYGADRPRPYQYWRVDATGRPVEEIGDWVAHLAWFNQDVPW